MSDPELWCVYDDHPLVAETGNKIDDPRFAAKLSAFSHLHLNMFEIILNEAPNPAKSHQENQSDIWLNYFHDTLSRSRRIEKLLKIRKVSGFGARLFWLTTDGGRPCLTKG